MAKRAIKNSPRLAIAREGAFYSDDDITAIIDATGLGIPPGRHDELVQRLEQAVGLDSRSCTDGEALADHLIEGERGEIVHQLRHCTGAERANVNDSG